ncbi:MULTISPECIES: hypothetical protein [Pseudoalteromonas]|uniref:Orphan protein n=2 Tax=Pseudoalteromonas TaxID=53246 RepID=A0A0F6A946_9GAMM|nr:MULTISPECIES: hypothetical protein [Pseudoalteromonas]AOT09872.1 hypothetical protein S4054249_19465 [Pseudoalteromonas luteoviolacea]AOT14784.1 hypothetical protein S40542_19435 [Pseudoalteromonas luteoviolacea]AOT19699.1 hypothetical protein S4054_19440 [Pseudoalteromonas luteoviolacea]KKE82673.1 hypothetical protein N479_17245 [Pseudoalteromonas luteoviolacea S4054]KZN67245.1 hypothetical protein N481_24080 [Pseudoalteromonas luteoviolacea S4047-1]
MNISGSNLPAMSGAGPGGEVYSASLAKKQQQADGRAALALIESAGSSAAAQTPAKSVTATLGNNINVYA